jgi:hypothetical protein
MQASPQNTADAIDAHPSVTASQPWLNVLGSRFWLDWLVDEESELSLNVIQRSNFGVG